MSELLFCQLLHPSSKVTRSTGMPPSRTAPGKTIGGVTQGNLGRTEAAKHFIVGLRSTDPRQDLRVRIPVDLCVGGKVTWGDDLQETAENSEVRSM